MKSFAATLLLSGLTISAVLIGNPAGAASPIMFAFDKSHASSTQTPFVQALNELSCAAMTASTLDEFYVEFIICKSTGSTDSAMVATKMAQAATIAGLTPLKVVPAPTLDGDNNLGVVIYTNEIKILTNSAAEKSTALAALPNTEFVLSPGQDQSSPYRSIVQKKDGTPSTDEEVGGLGRALGVQTERETIFIKVPAQAFQASFSSFSRHVFGQAAISSCSENFQSNDILYVGDSISTSWLHYSSSLAQALTREGHGNSIVARYAVGASASLQWVNGFKGSLFTNNKNTLCVSRDGIANGAVNASEVPVFSKLVKNSPRAVVIALGTNDIDSYCKSIKDSGGRLTAGAMWLKGAHDLATLANNPSRNCVWILPLTYTSGEIFKNCQAVPYGVEGAIASLKKAVSPMCSTIDSSKVCPLELGFDKVGIHPISGSAQLGSCIGEAVNKELSLYGRDSLH